MTLKINNATYTEILESGRVSFTLSNLPAGAYDAIIIYDGGLNHNNESKSIKFNVFKLNAVIVAFDKSYVINYGGKYSITLKDEKGSVFAGQRVTFTLNGKAMGSAVTDAKGVATIALTANMLKAAKAGNKNLIVKLTSSNYQATKTVKITVSKEKTKIAAKKKTFKKAQKVKKYTITLKNSKGKAVKKVQVTLKVKAKTFKAKTNAKGKAIFKIKKLTKKGTFKAKITFKGDNYYLKTTKNVKIIIK